MRGGKNVKYLRASLQREQTLRGPNGDYSGTLTRATLYHDGARAAGFELDLRFAHPVYQRLADDGAFELTPDKRGAIFGGADAMSADQPVTITVFMRPERLAAFFSTSDAFESEAAAVLGALESDDHELRRTDAWIFVSVFQDVPGHAFQIGFKHADYQDTDAHLQI